MGLELQADQLRVRLRPSCVAPPSNCHPICTIYLNISSQIYTFYTSALKGTSTVNSDIKSEVNV